MSAPEYDPPKIVEGGIESVTVDESVSGIASVTIRPTDPARIKRDREATRVDPAPPPAPPAPPDPPPPLLAPRAGDRSGVILLVAGLAIAFGELVHELGPWALTGLPIVGALVVLIASWGARGS